jgi:hypothetical protein
MSDADSAGKGPRLLAEGVDDLVTDLERSIRAQMKHPEQRFEKLSARASARLKVDRILEEIEERETELKLQKKLQAKEQKQQRRRARAQKQSSSSKERNGINDSGSNNVTFEKPSSSPRAARASSLSTLSSMSPREKLEGGRNNVGTSLQPFHYPPQGCSFTLVPPRIANGATTFRLPRALARAEGDEGDDDDGDGGEVEGDGNGSGEQGDDASQHRRQQKGRGPGEQKEQDEGKADATSAAEAVTPSMTPWGAVRPASRPGSKQVKKRLPPIACSSP